MSKRDREPDWKVVLEDSSPLRAIVDATATVMTRVCFKVVRQEDGRFFLKVDSADIAYTCCVSARLVLDEVSINIFETDEDGKPTDKPVDEINFCVDCKHLSSAIDNPSCSHLALIMEGYEDKVVVVMKDADQPAFETFCELSLYMDEDPVALQKMDFEMVVELDLTLLREMMKKARKSKTEYLRIRIFTTKEEEAKKLSVVIFSVEGDFVFEQKICHPITRGSDGSLEVVRAAADGTDKLVDVEGLDAKYDHKFPVEKIESFVKQLPCRMLEARVKRTMPLMFNYDLKGTGDDSSHIRFMVAPVTDEEE